MAKKVTVSSKFDKVSNQYTVNEYDNGFMVEISGRDKDENWKSARIIADGLDELVEIITEIANMKKDD